MLSKTYLIIILPLIAACLSERTKLTLFGKFQKDKDLLFVQFYCKTDVDSCGTAQQLE